MTSSFPEADVAATRIVVDVPHWSAAVALIDNDLRPVAGVGRVMPVAGDPFLGRVTATVMPGVYEVQATLDGKTQAKWVVAQPGADTSVPVETWTELVIETALPLPATAPSATACDRLAEAATRATRGAGEAGELASVSLFASAVIPAEGEVRDFDLDVSLLDERGERVASLEDDDASARVEQRWMWRCSFSLPPGYYVLRAFVPRPRSKAAPGPGGDPPDPPRYRYQPLFLCSGLETHVFLRCDGAPDLGSMTITMSAPGRGYDPARDEAIAADAVLTALAHGDASRVLLGSERLAQLLRGDERHPWLGVLAGYALLSGEMDHAAEVLLGEIRRDLREGPLAGHPDARALMLDDEPAEPFAYPPMLRAGLRRVRSYAAKQAGLIAPDSPLAQLDDWLVADSAWTAWVDQVPHPSRPEADGQADTSSSMPASIPAFVEAFPVSAPVFPLTAYVEKDEDEAVDEGATLAAHAAIIEAASEALGRARNGVLDAMQVRLRDRGEDLLAVTAENVSRLSGVSLDSVRDGFAALKRTQPGAALMEAAGALRQPLGVLVAAVQAKHAETMVDALVEGSGASALPMTPIESQVERLEAEAARLSAAARPEHMAGGADEQAASDTMAAYAERLRAAAARLLQQAHLVIVADETGRLRYGNRLLRDRLLQRPEGSERAIARIAEVLDGLADGRTVIPAVELSPNSPEALAGSDIEVQRQPITDHAGQLQGHGFFLRATTNPALPEEKARKIDELLPQITLFAAMAELGAGDKRAEKLARLGSDLDRLERLLTT